MRSTLPKISEAVNCYESCHKNFHKPWRGWHRPAAYGEIPAQNLFEGKFTGQSVSKKDFTKDISEHGRPSTSCKPVQKAHINSSAKFDGTTTNSEFFVAPEHEQREILLRKKSKKNVETLEPLHGRVEHMTQYRQDNPGFWKHPPKQSMCAPHPDTLTLSSDTRMDLKTLHQTSYQTKWAQQPRPSTSCKKNQDYYHSNAAFDGERRHQVDFKPVPPAVQLQLCQSIDQQAASFAYAQKDGKQMKTAYNFGRAPFCAETVNQSEYFRFKKPPTQIRHGDKSERPFQPSTIKFEAVSESHARFVPQKGKPAESLKPLDSRYKQNSSGGEESKGRQPWGTTYAEEFPCRELPRRDICPAELLLA